MAGSRWRVLVSEPIHPDGLALLREHAEVRQGRPGSAESLFAGLEEADGLIVRTAPLPGDWIRRARRLRVIARHGVGVDNIDLEAATARGIPVVTTPEANAVSVAEHVLGMMLALCRRLVEADRAVREGRWSVRDAADGAELHGKTLGIVGLGRVGGRLARMARAGLGMGVLGHDPLLPPQRFAELEVERCATLEELLRQSDVVSLHLPLTPQTRGLIGRNELARLKPGAILVNAARGGLVDEDALAAGLRRGQPRAAGLDVLAEEPPPAGHPLLGLPNVLLTPHSAGLTGEARRRMAVGAARRVLEVLGGRPPQDCVNLTG